MLDGTSWNILANRMSRTNDRFGVPGKQASEVLDLMEKCVPCAAQRNRVWNGLNQEKDSHGILFTPVDIGGRPLSYSVTSPASDVRS